jgi:hypothetical protein
MIVTVLKNLVVLVDVKVLTNFVENVFMLQAEIWDYVQSEITSMFPGLSNV